MKAKNITHLITLTLALLTTCLSVFGQEIRVSGVVTDKITGQPLEDVLVYVNDRLGNITDTDGNYEVTFPEVPFKLEFILPGSSYASWEIEIKGIEENNINIGLIEKTDAGRKPESIPPFTIERLNSKDIKHAASADYYDEIARFKGVYNIQANRNFNSMNARGFGPHGNIRLVQLIDGMDNVMPSLNFSLGSVTAVPELDVERIEFMPGASSALYGPNAFNGIILMSTKSPFDYQGVSAQVKSGFTDDATRIKPFRDMSIRYAEELNSSFAFKFNFSEMEGSDWIADNYTEHLKRYPQDNFIASQGDIHFNGVNLYGDEIPVLEDTLRRTGWKEIELLGEDYKIKSRKFDIALHYKINKSLEAVASYKYGQGTTIYQSNARYVLRDFPQQFFKIELRDTITKWNIRAYRTTSKDGRSYSLNSLGGIANPAMFSNIDSIPAWASIGGNDDDYGGWLGAYFKALRGEFESFGIDSTLARQFADGGGLSYLSEEDLIAYRNTLANYHSPEEVDFILESLSGVPRYGEDGKLTTEAIEIIEAIKNRPLNQSGAAFIDDSKLNHIEVNYDMSKIFGDKLSAQIGGNWRRYDVFSGGTILNEQDNKSIKINEFGAYLQASEKTLNDHLKLTGSFRFDKSGELPIQFSPRVSAVYSIDDSLRHNIRASYQLAHRNPTVQERYIFFPVGRIILIGGAEGIVEGDILHNGSACNITSMNCDALGSIKPERLRALDIGYKGIFKRGKGFLGVDINAYHNTYNNFIIADNYVATDIVIRENDTISSDAIFLPYFNAPFNAYTYGITGDVKYANSEEWVFEGNYSYNNNYFGKKNSEGFRHLRNGFNTPTHRINLGVHNRKLTKNKNLSFSAYLRWQSKIDWQGTFNGRVPPYTTIDTQIGYRFLSDKITFKFGINNLMGKEYITNYGGAGIGRVMYFGITYDELFGRQ